MCSAFLRMALAAGLSGLLTINAQEARVHSLSLVPGYTYFGSIDEIHSPYRYGGWNFSVMATYTLHRQAKFHTFSLSYESLERYPAHLPVSESIFLESYDSSRGSYLWPTTPSFLKKQTYWMQQNIGGYYQLPGYFISGKWYLGYIEELTVVNCPNVPTLELLSLSLGTTIYGLIPLTKNMTSELNLGLFFISLDVRNSYSSVDGYTGEKKNFSYYYEYLNRHMRLNGPWNHLVFAVHQGFHYRFSQRFGLQAGYRLMYRRLEIPRMLKSVSVSYQLGLQYAW